jgi:hypothetical protein
LSEPSDDKPAATAPFEPKSKFWMNLPPVLMDTYLDLVRSLADMDTRASYLMTFGDALSMVLPKALEDYQEYKGLAERWPLPYEDPLKKISHEHYRRYMKTYESIMRKAGIVGGINTGTGDEEESWDFTEDEDEQRAP